MPRARSVHKAQHVPHRAKAEPNMFNEQPDGGVATPHAVAELVVHYRRRDGRRKRWSQGTVEWPQVIGLTRTHHAELRRSLAIGRDANRAMGAPVTPAAAVAFLLLDNGHDLALIRRFFAAPSTLEDVDDNDPRRALRRVMYSFTEDDPQLAMGYMLKAWGLWVTGGECRMLKFAIEDGMPPIASWPSVELPGLSTTDA